MISDHTNTVEHDAAIATCMLTACDVSLYTLFFLQTHHILPPIFSWGPSIFPEYSREYFHRKPFTHPRGAEKWSFRGRKGVSECVFARPFREKPLSHAKPTVNTADQLFRHHKHEVKPPNRRNMWEIAVRNPRNGRNMWIFPIWNVGKM